MFRDYTDPVTGTYTELRTDVYDPPPGTVNPPATILLHGGGWWKGCKHVFDGIAQRLADKGFLVFNADYRLACPRNMQWTDERVVRLCGWKWQDTVADGYPANVSDVLYLVKRIRQQLGNQYAPNGQFNGDVAIMGGSAGGNLAYLAGAFGTDAQTNRSDAVAGWSGMAEMYAFDEPPEGSTDPRICPNQNEVETCWNFRQSYIGCDARGLNPPQWCVDLWNSAAPREQYDELVFGTEQAPPFIANSTLETEVEVQQAVEFHQHLADELLYTPQIDEAICKVTGDFHGAKMINSTLAHCDGLTELVLDSTVAWMFAYHIQPPA